MIVSLCLENKIGIQIDTPLKAPNLLFSYFLLTIN